KYYLLLALLLTVTVVFVIVIFNLSLFKKVFLPNFPTGFYMARAGDSDNLISAVNAGLSCTNGAKTMPLANTTFLKTYRLLVFTKINGAWPTKDGGYIVSGITDPNIMFLPPDGFVAKLDKQGSVKWMKFLKSTNSAGVGNARGEEDVQSIIELKNGGYLMASKVWGFIKTAESSAGVEVNKILFTKLDKNGNMVWNKSLTAFVEDARNSLVETNDGGFLFHTNMVGLSPSKRGEDSDVYQDMPFASLKVLKFDQNGNLLWSKNIKNFIARKNDSYLTQTSDGGYALAGNIAETNPEKALPYNFDTYPGLAKFDKNFNFQWAKSMEGAPLDMAMAIPKADGGYEMGWKKWRQGAMAVHGFVQTKDNGFLVLGNMSGLSMLSDSFDLKTGVKNWMMGFKFSSSGNLEWVKKTTFGFNEFTSPMMGFSMSVTADDQIMVAGPITWAANDYHAQIINANAERDLYCVKYQISEEKCKANQIDNIENSEQTKQDWEKVQALYQAVQDDFRPGIFVMKVDDELKTIWAKIINPRRGATNFVLKSTTDSGAIIAGEHVSTDIKSMILDSITYYKDGFLMKLDASGNVADNKNWIINYNGPFVTELMTPYAVSNDLVVKTDPFKIKLTSRKPEFSLYKKSKTTAFAPFSSSQTTPCPVPPEISANDVPLLNSTITSTAPRTWPQINYEKAVPLEQLVNDRSRTLNNELLPILNQLYNSQVKLTDNLSGQMLSYIFSWVITKEDVIAVKNYLVGLGYKTQDEGNNQLTMYKPGYFLILSFSVGNLNKAFLDVTY
ncbi:MAG: hypothetical protein AAB963_02370, partial [Patescibacteria group bacterium]